MKGKGELISIIVPMHNDEDVILNTAKKLTRLENKYNLELIFVDDGSSDSTLKIMKNYAKEHKCISIYENKRNLGKGGAIKNGVSHSHGNKVLFTDADLAYGIKQVKEILELHQKNDAEITIGSRILHKEGYSGYSPVRKITSKIFRLITKYYIKLDVTDTQAGLKCFDGEVARKLFKELKTYDFAFDIELLLIAKNLGYKISEMPVKIIANDNNGSSINVVRDSVRMLKDLYVFHKKYCENRFNKILMICSVVATFLFLGIHVFLSFATDTYGDVFWSTKEIVGIFCSSGRFITAIFLGLSKFLHLSFHAIYLVSFILMIISISLSLYYLTKLLQKLIKNWPIAFMLSVMIVICPFIVEIVHYLEMGTMTLGILLCIIATKKFIEFTEGDKKSLLKAFGIFFLACCCYQGVVGLFIALATIFVVKKSRNLKGFLINTVFSVLVYGGGVIINMLLAQLLTGSDRASSHHDLIGTLAMLGEGFKNIFIDFMNIMPSVIMYGFLILIILIALIDAIKEKQLKSFFIRILQSVYLYGVVLLAAIAPQLAWMQGSFSAQPRVLYVYGAIIGISSVVMISDGKNITTRYGRTIGCLMVIFLIFDWYNINKIAMENYTVNAIDKNQILLIQSRINSYETKSGKVITKIVPIRDSIITWHYLGMLNYGDVSVPVMASGHEVHAMNYYTGRNYSRVEEIPEEMDTYCKKENWSDFQEEQLVFKGDTLYLCKY